MLSKFQTNQFFFG